MTTSQFPPTSISNTSTDQVCRPHAQVAAEKEALERQKSLVKIVSNIRRSLDIETIGQVATDEIRQLIEADRVAIYQFNDDWSGEFAIESVAPGWKPLAGPDSGQAQPIEDTHLMETRGGRYALGETFAVSDIYQAGHADCHIALLEKFQAKAYAIAPIFQDDKLWGLVAAFQNSNPRQWLEDEVQLLAQIGEQLGVALQQAEYVSQISAQSEELKQLIRDLERSQVQLVQKEKMASLGRLVAGVAHEINNPVNFIHGNLKHIGHYLQDLFSLISLYQEQYPQYNPIIQEQIEEIDLSFIVEDLPKTVQSMKHGSERIREIVLSLRNFSRLDESGLKTIDIHEGIDNTLLILGHRLKTPATYPKIEIIKQYGELPPIECYPAQLNQVFMNLLSNAIDALEEAFPCTDHADSNREAPNREESADTAQQQVPKIWIATALGTSGQIEIRIKDNGSGIPLELQKQVFDHFFTTKAVGKGTGLGLAITQDIVLEKHQGNLQLKSTLGEGTEFILELPIKQQQSPQQQSTADAGREPLG